MQNVTLHRQAFNLTNGRFHLGRTIPLCDRDPGAGRVQNANRLIRQLPPGDITGRQRNSLCNRLVQNAHLVMFFQTPCQASHHRDCAFWIRLVHFNDLEAPGQRGVFLNILFVFRPCCRSDGAQFTPCQGRLQQIGRISLPRSATSTNQRMSLINEQNDRTGGGFHRIDDGFQAIFKLPLHRCARLQQGQVQNTQIHIPQRFWHIAISNPLGKPFDHGCLPDPGFTGQDGIVLAAAHQDIDHLPYLSITPDNRINCTNQRLIRQGDRIKLQRIRLGGGGSLCRLFFFRWCTGFRLLDLFAPFLRRLCIGLAGLNRTGHYLWRLAQNFRPTVAQARSRDRLKGRGAIE